MKRGIIRIVAGIVLIISQMLAIIAQASMSTNTNTNMWLDIDSYSVGIVGILLLIFGSRAYRYEIYSELVLHSKKNIMHTIAKWSAFTLSSLLFVLFLIGFLYNFQVYTLLMAFATLSFSVYSLFYMYKKPSCLFSTTLIFIGIAYIYESFMDLFTHLSDVEYSVLYLVLSIIPNLIAGVLYIIIATETYKEDYSVEKVKALGWSAFTLEIINRALYITVVFQNLYFFDLVSTLYILFTVVLMLYINVFEINTLRGAPVLSVQKSTGFSFSSGWLCSCGKTHPSYETSCACGKSKFDNTNQSITAEIVSKTVENFTSMAERVCFCRKCGSKLLDDASFCSKCGTQIVKE